jgi:hypothetical protein
MAFEAKRFRYVAVASADVAVSVFVTKTEHGH